MFYNSAIWWRSKISLDGERIVPVEPFISYDPFTYYYPYGKATRKGEQSLPYRFVNVNPDNVQDVAAFCEAFGVLGDPSVTWDKWDGEPFLARLLPNFAEPKPSHGPKLGKGLHHSLLTHMTLGQFQEAQAGLQDLIRQVQVTRKAPTLDALDNARAILCERFAGELTKVRPRLRWDSQRPGWMTGWDTLSLVSTMCLMLLFDFQGRGQILICRWCHNTFFGDHPGTVFCSRKCQNAANVSAWRKKQKEPSKAAVRGSHIQRTAEKRPMRTSKGDQRPRKEGK